MLTRPGWLVALGGIAFVAAGRILGVFELFLLGAACAAIITVAVVSVLRARLRLEVGRTVTPSRVHAGTPARVELRVLNVAHRRTPVLRLHDPVTGTQGATVMLAPIEPSGSVRSAYRLPTDQRGILAVGPLAVVVGDAFGLAAVRASGAPRTELTVLPHVDEILPPPRAGGDEPLAGIRTTTLAASGGHDFAALRAYVVGDDLRRVHWPSTARHGELLIRQDEVHWQGRTTVVLDTRAATHTHESFEVAVSAAASVVTAAWKRRDLVRLTTTEGWDSGIAAGQGHAEQVLEFLATVRATAAGSLRGVADGLSRTAGGTGVVAIVGDLRGKEADALAALRTRVGALTVVRIDSGVPGEAAAEAPLPPASPDLVHVAPGRPFRAAWNTAMAARRPSRTAAARAAARR